MQSIRRAHGGAHTATLRLILSTLVLALGVVPLAACDDSSSVEEAAEELRDSAEDAADEVRDEIDDHT